MEHVVSVKHQWNACWNTPNFGQGKVFAGAKQHVWWWHEVRSLLLQKNMRVAIPTFGADISPRFCFAREMVVIDIVGGAEVGRGRIELGDASWPERLAILTARRVDVLLCGGFPRQYLPVAEAVGIQVVVGLAGTVEEVLGAFRDGKVADLVAFPRLDHGQRCAGGRSKDPKGKHR